MPARRGVRHIQPALQAILRYEVLISDRNILQTKHCPVMPYNAIWFISPMIRLGDANHAGLLDRKLQRSANVSKSHLGANIEPSDLVIMISL